MGSLDEPASRVLRTNLGALLPLERIDQHGGVGYRMYPRARSCSRSSVEILSDSSSSCAGVKTAVTRLHRFFMEVDARGVAEAARLDFSFGSMARSKISRGRAATGVLLMYTPGVGATMT